MMETAFLNLALNLGNQRHGLGVEVVEVEDQQGGAIGLGQHRGCGLRFLVALHKLHLDTELARGLLSFGDKKTILNEQEDAGGSVFADGAACCGNASE